MAILTEASAERKTNNEPIFISTAFEEIRLSQFGELMTEQIKLVPIILMTVATMNKTPIILAIFLFGFILFGPFPGIPNDK